MRGALTVIGTGIRFGVHLTPEARAALLAADHVLHLVSEPVSREWIESLRPDAESLHSLYEPGKDRAAIYGAIVKAILEPVYRGARVCAAFYGHAGVFVSPSHEAIRQARAAGCEATMLPAISAEDCLFADLGLDPGATGCQTYEATDFVVNRRLVDPAALLILWQAGVVGERSHVLHSDPDRLRSLVERLLELYPTDHEAVVYEASPYPIGRAIVVRTPVQRLGDVGVTPAATLVVPPRGHRVRGPTARNRPEPAAP